MPRDDGCVWPPPYGPPDGERPGPGPEIGGEHPEEGPTQEVDPEGTNPDYWPTLPPEAERLPAALELPDIKSTPLPLEPPRPK